MSKLKLDDLIKIYLSLVIIGGLVVLGVLISIPSESYDTGLLGYSLSRILLMLGVLVFEIFLSAYLGILWRRPAFLEKHLDKLSTWLQKSWFTIATLLVSFFVFIFGLDFLFSFVTLNEIAASPLLLRIAPLIGWVTGIAGLNILVIIVWRNSKDKSSAKIERKAFWRAVFLIWGVFAGWLIHMQFTGMGLVMDITGWDFPGTPILFSQIVLTWFVGLLFFMFFLLNKRVSDRWIFLLIWILAAIIWIAEPIHATHYSLEPVPPNFDYTPYSDAAVLVVNAENLLIGEGFKLLVEKPLYNVLLAFLMTAGRHDYIRVVTLQITILSLFPAVVYLLSARLDQRLVGIITAGLLILRERNAIALANRINVSNSKMIMTDFPAALMIVVFVYVLIRWLQHPDRKNSALLAGGVLGACILVRSQALVFIPIVGLVLLVHFWRQWKFSISSGVVFVLGVLACILPWMLRNWAVYGEFGYSQPMQATYLDSQYSFDPGSFDLVKASPEDRIDQGFGNAIDFARQNPGYVARFIVSHFFHNEISALLALPVQSNLSSTAFDKLGVIAVDGETNLRAYVDNLPFWNFQNRWQGEWPTGTLILLIVNLIIIGLGIGYAWSSWGWMGILPLLIHLGYSLSSAIARVSGSRFILPVDWILIWYFVVGLGLLSRNLLGLDAENQQQVSHSDRQDRYVPLRKPLLWMAGIFLLGALVPILEILPPSRYPARNVDELKASINLNVGDYCDPLGQPIGSEHDIHLQGRALFPRYYDADDGYAWGGAWIAYNPFPFPRLGFYLAGPENWNILLPTAQVPGKFPNASDAIIIGSFQGEYIQAKSVTLLLSDNEQVTYFSDEIGLCPTK